MTCEQEVAPGTRHGRIQASVVGAVSLHHVHACSCVKHTDGSTFEGGFVSA